MGEYLFFLIYFCVENICETAVKNVCPKDYLDLKRNDTLTLKSIVPNKNVLKSQRKIMDDEINCLRPASGVSAPCEGEYTWTYREPLLHLQKYSLLIRLIDFVETIRCKRFYEPGDRFQMLMSACILRETAPFCQNRRFPEDYWANLSTGPMANALDRLITSLDIPASDFYGHIQITASDLDLYKVKFDGAMEELRRLVYCTDLDKLADIGVYNRQSFEQRYSMQWKEHAYKG